jgi:type I restriction enzyme S subunit
MKKIGKEVVQIIPVPVPPLPAQKAIVRKLDAMRNESKRLEILYQQKLAALDALKKSLLHQAFSGQLGERRRVSATEGERRGVSAT